MRSEFAYWAEQPDAIRALAELRRTPEGWSLGFFEFVTAEFEAFRRNRTSTEPLGASSKLARPPQRPPAHDVCYRGAVAGRQLLQKDATG
jgi:hypothetical protein